MSEPERPNDLSYNPSSLASLIVLMLGFALTLAVTNVGLFLASGNLTGAAIAVIAAIAGLLLALARRLALRRRRHAAVMIFAVTLSLGAIAVVWIEPASVPVAVLIPPLILISTLQYLRSHEVGPLIFFTCLVAVVLAIESEVARPWFTSQAPLAPALRITALVGAVLLLAVILWRFGARLHATLARLEAANAALRDSEARYRSVVEEQTDLICRSRPDGIVTLVNEASCRYWGLKRDEIIGSDLRRFVHPDDIPHLNRHLESLTPEAPVGTIEHRVILPNGEVRWQRWTNRALYDGERLIGYQSVGRDITERKRVEEQLFRSERQFKAIAENAPDIISRYDLQGRYLYVNPAFEQATGTTSAEIVGKTQRERGIPEHIAQLWDACFQAAIETQSVQTIEFDLQMPSGHRFYESRIVPELGPDGNVESLLAISRDVTERRKHELVMQHRQKLESMGVMAQGIAHEFNNLLGIILNNAELALTTLPPQSPERLSIEAITCASRRAAAITRQMLTYVGHHPLQTSLLSLNDLIREMADLLQASITKSASLVYRLCDHDPIVEGDAAQLRQVLLNLTINAAEAIGDRSGEVVVSTDVRFVDRTFLATTVGTSDLPDGTYAVLSVSDNGCGMDAATLERIFDPFFSTKFIGRGLGLPATLGIVRGHRGAIHVASAPGEGTTISVFLPIVHQPLVRTSFSSQTPLAAYPDYQKIFLVVDDEESVRAVAARMLEWMGHPVLTTDHAETAVILARQHRQHLACILLDATMPDRDLYETVRDLRQACPDTPIVLMSGYTEDIAIRRFSRLGLNGFLQKPFTSQELRDAIDYALAAI
ncbi:MAG: PAS domain S-box protein [Roseiflexaceae bacterium]|nr:PAS domain S-box protein [Roseiflexus sp.]MDW8212893.1 PAS domain S-box protein [Roseiflexaceae bacterium]